MRPRETSEGSRGPLPNLNQPQKLSNQWGPPQATKPVERIAQRKVVVSHREQGILACSLEIPTLAIQTELPHSRSRPSHLVRIDIREHCTMLTC